MKPPQAKLAFQSVAAHTEIKWAFGIWNIENDLKPLCFRDYQDISRMNIPSASSLRLPVYTQPVHPWCPSPVKFPRSRSWRISQLPLLLFLIQNPFKT